MRGARAPSSGGESETWTEAKVEGIRVVAANDEAAICQLQTGAGAWCMRTDLRTSIHQSVYHVLVDPPRLLQFRDERLIPPVFGRGW